MKRRSRLLLPLLVTVALGGAVWSMLHPREPIYEGKPVGFWLGHPKKIPLTNFSWFMAGSVYTIEFPRMDSNAVPSLIKGLSKRDGRLEKLYSSSWNKFPKLTQRCLPAPAMPAVSVRCNATMVLSKMGPEAKPAVSALFQMMLTDEEEMARGAAASALLAMSETGPEWLEAWREAAKDKSSSVRTYAHAALDSYDRKMNGSISLNGIEFDSEKNSVIGSLNNFSK